MIALAPLDLSTALPSALEHHQAGRVEEAQAAYRAIVAAYPEQVDANHNLGMLLLQAGQYAQGVPFLHTAWRVQPEVEQFSVSYAIGLFESGQAAQALAVIEAAQTRGMQGEVLHKLKDIVQSTLQGAAAPVAGPAPEAVQQLVASFQAADYDALDAQARAVLEQFPETGVVWKIWGASMHMRGLESITMLQRATRFLPDDVDAHNLLGAALHGAGHLHEAVQSFQRAVTLAPTHANAHYNLGNALFALHQFAAAAQSYRVVVQLQPDFAEAYSNLGNALQSVGDLAGAVANYRQALAIKPSLAGVLSNLANVLRDQGELDQALDYYQQALALAPNLAEVHNNLGKIYRDLGQLEAAVASYRQALVCRANYTEAFSNLLFVQNYLPTQEPAALLAQAQQFGALVAQQATVFTQWNNVPDPARRLRVGLVSGDLRTHPVGYFLDTVLQALARDAADAVELIAYANHHVHDPLTQRLQSYCSQWHEVAAWSDAQLAQHIHDQAVDILIDLSGHTAHNRLPMFAYKPAPVQMSWLGYFATTGVPGMDYLLGDPHSLPPSAAAAFTETIWRMPHTRLCFSAPLHEVLVAPLPALQAGYVTFGCFNQLAKMNDAVVALWAQVLHAVPDSRLLLKAAQLKEESVQHTTVARFAAHGIAANRLMLEGPTARAQYLAAYHRVDIALDPFPYTGGATSAESLWMGVPVLTLQGDSFLARQGAGLVINAGLPDWVATDAPDYVARAVAYAGDLPRLAALRAQLRTQVQQSPLFDARTFAHELNEALRGMWHAWCNC